MFDGKTIIVTGAASGIGKATANEFATNGGSVVIVDLNGDKASEAAQEIAKETGAKTLAVACDVSDSIEVADTVRKANDKFGHLDIIVNNAGLMTFRPIEELTEEDWLSILRVDLLGAFFFIKEGFKVMKAGSAIVNVSSIHARETTPNVAPYAAAKAGLVSLTRSASIEGKSKHIRVNCILPGAIDTPMLWSNPNLKSGLEHVGLSDVGKPEDVARAVAFLAAPTSAFITGTSLAVDGGRLISLS